MNGIPDVSSYLTKTPVPPKILNTQLKHAQSRNKSKQLNEELTNSMKRLTGKCNKSLGNTEMILKSLVAKNKELGTLKDSLKHLPSKISSLNTLLSSVNIPENLDELLGELKTAIKFNSYGITYVQGSILESSDLKGGVTIDSKLRKKHLIDSISSKMSLQFTCAGSSSKISSKSAIEELVVVDCLYNPIINLNDDCILVIEYYNTGVPFTIDIITLLKIFGTNCALILNLKDVEYNKCLMKVNDKIERMYRKSVQQNETEKLKDLLLEGVTYLNGCIDLESVTLLGTLIDLCRAFVKTGDSVFCDDGKVWGEEGIKAFVEDGEKEFEDFDSFTYVIECKNLEGGVNGYVVFRRLKSVIVSESTVEHKFKDSELKAFKELSGIVGSSIERIQNLETEKRLLNDTSISSVKKLKAIEEKEIRRKAQQSYEGFKGQKDAQEIKGEVLRLKTRIITLEKFGKGQESRRIKGDRILEKTKKDAALIISNLRKATEKKNEDIKRLVNKHLSEHSSLISQNHSLAKEKDKLSSELEKVKKEMKRLEREVEGMKGNEKANEVLVRNHRELTEKVDVLIRSSGKKKKKENKEVINMPTRLRLSPKK